MEYSEYQQHTLKLQGTNFELFSEKFLEIEAHKGIQFHSEHTACFSMKQFFQPQQLKAKNTLYALQNEFQESEEACM